MITLNIEIRFANSFQGAALAKKVDKTDVLLEIVKLAMQALHKTNTQGYQRPFIISVSKKWKRLPKVLYRVREQGKTDSIIFAKTRRKISLPESEMIQVCLIYSESLHTPHLVMDIRNPG